MKSLKTNIVKKHLFYFIVICCMCFSATTNAVSRKDFVRKVQEFERRHRDDQGVNITVQMLFSRPPEAQRGLIFGLRREFLSIPEIRDYLGRDSDTMTFVDDHPNLMPDEQNKLESDYYEAEIYNSLFQSYYSAVYTESNAEVDRRDQRSGVTSTHNIREIVVQNLVEIRKRQRYPESEQHLELPELIPYRIFLKSHYFYRVNTPLFATEAMIKYLPNAGRHTENILVYPIPVDIIDAKTFMDRLQYRLYHLKGSEKTVGLKEAEAVIISQIQTPHSPSYTLFLFSLKNEGHATTLAVIFDNRKNRILAAIFINSRNRDNCYYNMMCERWSIGHNYLFESVEIPPLLQSGDIARLGYRGDDELIIAEPSSRITVRSSVPFINASHNLQLAPDDQNCSLYSINFLYGIKEFLAVKGREVFELATLLDQGDQTANARLEVMFKEDLKEYLYYYDTATRQPKSSEQIKEFHLRQRWNISSITIKDPDFLEKTGIFRL